jgi:hypothetical protein
VDGALWTDVGPAGEAVVADFLFTVFLAVVYYLLGGGGGGQ